MLLRLTRSLTNFTNKSSFGSNQEDALAKNIQIINDDMNYTLPRVSRVIGAYLHLGLRATSLTWEIKKQVIKSFLKLNRIVKHLDPNSVNALIVNIGYIRIWPNEIWEELEKAFLKKSFKCVGIDNISQVCSSFQGAQRKNAEVWRILEEILINEVYNSSLLDNKQLSNVLVSFAVMNQGSDQLFSKFEENTRFIIKDLEIAPLVDILKGFLCRKKYDPDLIDELLACGLELVPLDTNKSYHNLLKYSLQLNASDERIKEIENLYLRGIYLEPVNRQLSIVLYYLSDSLKPTDNRKDFLQKLFENLVKNEEELMALEKSEYKRSAIKATFIYVPFKFGALVSDAELVNIFNLIGEKTGNLDDKVKGIHLEVKEYLKGKNLI